MTLACKPKGQSWMAALRRRLRQTAVLRRLKESPQSQTMKVQTLEATCKKPSTLQPNPNLLRHTPSP